MKVEMWSVDKVTPYDRNPRVNDKAVAAVAKSIETFGFRQPLVVDAKGVIVVGHTRYAAALLLGMKEVPVHVTKMAPAKCRAYRIADNKTNEAATWDDDLLSQEIADLVDFDWTELGFGQGELDDLLGGESTGADPDDVPDTPEDPITQRGDVWVMGDHRLLCGDATSLDDVALLMAGTKAQLCFTSPPYWVGKEYENQTTLDEVMAFIAKSCEVMAAAVTSDGGRIVVNCSTASARAINPKADAETMFTLAWWQNAFRDKHWLMRHCRVWLKHGDMAAPRVAARSDVVDQHWELIPEFLPTFYNPDGLRRGQEKIRTKWAQLGIWTDIHGERSAGGKHCAAFPVELPRRYIMLYTKDGEQVLDPFAGSGTTIIAAEQLGRRCFGMEIEPRYCDVAVKRWEEFTGNKAERTDA